MSSQMRGVSADNLAALTDKLGQTVGSTDAAALGQDLFGLAQVLRTEPGVRRTLSDPSIDASAKAGLVRQLFDGKVSPAAIDLLADAVSRRWRVARDIADALEHLGVIAVVKSTDEGKRLSDELFTVAQVVQDDADLRAALSDPARSIEDKRALLRGLLDGKALPATIALVEQSLSGSYRTISVALEAYEQVASEVHGESVATIHTAQELSEADLERLGAALSRQYGRAVHLNVVVDPHVVGGLRVEIGDDVIDGSVSSRLDDARRRLAG